MSALHGRDAPMGVLRGALDAAIGGRGGLVVVSGEAGIGKSALVAELARETEQRGGQVVWGRAWEFADAPPYFPVLPCLRALGVEAQGDAFALWEQVLGALARASAPIVWLVEDVHAADLGTLDLLTFLAQPLRAVRALVVATARLADPRVDERMLQRLARMARDGVDLRLDALAERDIAAVAADALGKPAPPALLARLVELTGGNPLFVVECARAMRGGESSLALPPTVRQVVLERIAHLPEATRDALAAGAVLGRELAAAAIGRMTGVLPARVIDTLLSALRAGVVRETRPGHFAFTHVLVRDAIYDTLAAATRADLHARAEAALAPLGDASEIVVERARHALAAGAPSALDLATRALGLLEHERAFDRAHELHTRIAAARDAGVLPPADGATLLHAARVALAAGRADASRRLCNSVVVAARAAGDAELLGRAALLGSADVRPGVIDRAQVALLEEARAALGDHAPALGCRLLARLATAIQPAPDPSVPAAMARDARARAESLGDPSALVDVLELAGWGIYDAPSADRLTWSTELRDRALAAAELDKALTGHAWVMTAQIERGEFDAADREIAAMFAAADELGHPRHRWRTLLCASGLAVASGRVAESDRHVTEVEQLAPVIDDRALALALAMHRLMTALSLRRDDEVRARLAMLADDLRHVSNAPVMTAMIHGACAARIGDRDTARAQLATLLGYTSLAALLANVSPTDQMPAMLAEMVACAGDAAANEQMRDALARFESPCTTGGAFWFTYDGPVARVRGLVAAALGDRATAERELRGALSLSRTHRHLPWIAQCAHDVSALVGDAALAEEAQRIARELGMSGLVALAVVDAGPLRIERDGHDWRLVRGATAVTVRDSRGMQLLARLVERPNEEVHVLALASDEGTAAPAGDAGEALDARARKAYRRRLEELADALADAENRGDANAAMRIERERDALVGELARATGIAGKPRVSASTSERARINVQKRLREAIGRVTDADEALGRFLEHSVRTGTFCCFRP